MPASLKSPQPHQTCDTPLSFIPERLSFILERLSFILERLSFIIKRLSFIIKGLSFIIEGLSVSEGEIQIALDATSTGGGIQSSIGSFLGYCLQDQHRQAYRDLAQSG